MKITPSFPPDPPPRFFTYHQNFIQNSFNFIQKHAKTLNFQITCPSLPPPPPHEGNISFIGKNRIPILRGVKTLTLTASLEAPRSFLETFPEAFQKKEEKTHSGYAWRFSLAVSPRWLQHQDLQHISEWENDVLDMIWMWHALISSWVC